MNKIIKELDESELEEKIKLHAFVVQGSICTLTRDTRAYYVGYLPIEDKKSLMLEDKIKRVKC